MALFPCGNAGTTGAEICYILPKFQNSYENVIVTIFLFLLYKILRPEVKWHVICYNIAGVAPHEQVISTLCGKLLHNQYLYQSKIELGIWYIGFLHFSCKTTGLPCLHSALYGHYHQWVVPSSYFGQCASAELQISTNIAIFLS